MENSVSASQYPQERAEEINTKLHETANKPPWSWRCLSRKAARVIGVKVADLSPARLAMMAVGLQAGETRSLNWLREKKNFKGNYFYNFTG